MAKRKEPAKVWRENDLIKIVPVNGDSVYILDYSPEIFEKVEGIRWAQLHNGYLMGWVDKQRVLLHHLVLPKHEKLLVDHIDRDKHNNTRSNLRYATRNESGFNRNKQRSNKSGIVGVSYYKTRDKWRAQIRVEGRVTFLGYFDSKDEAAKAYHQAENHYYPDIRAE